MRLASLIVSLIASLVASLRTLQSIFHDIDENNDSSLCADELSKRGSGILAAFGADEDVDRFLRTYGTKDREALQR